MTLDKVKLFEEKRAALEKLNNDIVQKRQSFELSISDLVNAKEQLIEDIDNLTKELSKEALQDYLESNNKSLDYGFKIQERNVYEYDETEALNWAIDKKLFLSIDRKAFDSFLKTTDVQFVKKDKKKLVIIPKKIELND